jgi:hypothetical protein
MRGGIDFLGSEGVLLMMTFSSRKYKLLMVRWLQQCGIVDTSYDSYLYEKPKFVEHGSPFFSINNNNNNAHRRPENNEAQTRFCFRTHPPQSRQIAKTHGRFGFVDTASGLGA